VQCHSFPCEKKRKFIWRKLHVGHPRTSSQIAWCTGSPQLKRTRLTLEMLIHTHRNGQAGANRSADFFFEFYFNFFLKKSGVPIIQRKTGGADPSPRPAPWFATGGCRWFQMRAPGIRRIPFLFFLSFLFVFFFLLVFYSLLYYHFFFMKLPVYQFFYCVFSNSNGRHATQQKKWNEMVGSRAASPEVSSNPATTGTRDTPCAPDLKSFSRPD